MTFVEAADPADLAHSLERLQGLASDVVAVDVKAVSNLVGNRWGVVGL